jgi:hypothetical protein
MPGELILVTNGVYQTGARAVDRLSNRVVVTKAVILQGVNGPSVTAIIGYRDPGTTNGDAAVRCVYLAAGAVLSGFTLTNGATQTYGNYSTNRSGGGVFCETAGAVVTNCVLAGNSSSDKGGGAYQGTLNDCTLVGNSVMDQNGEGGGAYNATLNNCTLVGNTAVAAWNAEGGGACFGTLNNCTLKGNVADYGGGAFSATLNNCTLTGNSAGKGGGACAATLNDCMLTSNSAAEYGGGAVSSKLKNCSVMGNSADSGGGASGYYYYGSSTLTNCTLVGNSANQGGGANEAQLKNCILYYNTALYSDNFYNSSMDYCCTTPLPSTGTGNIAIEPALASFSHLSAASPCRGAGSAAYASGVDLDGEPWATPPSIGCDEYLSGSVTGALSVAILATRTNGVATSQLDFQALIVGRASASRWDFGDGVVVSNRPWGSHAWAAAGDYTLELRAYNDTFPSGISATITVHVAAQPVYYVSSGNAAPLAPYRTWATAATNIQDAVDAAVPEALVLVSNGVYQAGARVVYGVNNRVAVTKAMTIQSVNGPSLTAIAGYQVPGTVNGPAAIRCVYLTNRAVLSGFTLTNGATQNSGTFNDTNHSGGGVWCESVSAVVTNCVLVANSANYGGGGAYGGTLNNCNLTTNVANYGPGGGVSYGTLNNCVLMGNSALGFSHGDGGGVYVCTLNNCALVGNTASDGGGAYNSTLGNCTLTANSAVFGGACYECILFNCALNSNWADLDGGAVDGGSLNNCTLTENSAGQHGGGASDAALYNCTLVGNSASWGVGGGAYAGTLYNSIIYYNTARFGGDNHYDLPIYAAMNYCCTVPLPSTGAGNITNEPALASFSHLSGVSPCRGAGSAAYAIGVDLDGEPWANPPSIGCDEYWGGSVTGALSVAIVTTFTSVAVESQLDFKAVIGGRVSASRWDFGDGVMVSNRPFASHAWAAPGDYRVIATAYNETYPSGVSATVTVHVVTQPVHYVALASTAPLAPYTSWSTAATNIQDAVEVAIPGALVLVSNGIYQVGARAVYGMSNRVAVTKVMTIQSVNGPSVTTIAGYQVPGYRNGPAAVRCVYLTNGAVLSGFTLTNGATQDNGNSFANHYGGGIWCESLSAVVTNCILARNSAYDGGGGTYGGTLNNCTLTGNSTTYSGGGAGAYSSTLNNCMLTANSAAGDGGGACASTLNNCAVAGNSTSGSGGGAAVSTLNNCTLIGNWASSDGGGANRSTLNNCIIYFNRTRLTGNNYSSFVGDCIMNYCCTYPKPPSGSGNITNEPVLASTSHLSAQSPCRRAGSLAYVTGLDIDGEDWRSPPSIGCDEYWSGSVTGALTVSIVATYTNVAVGHQVDFQAMIGGRVSASRWDFGDGTVVSNLPYASHAWLASGSYTVELRAFNDSYPGGVATTMAVIVVVPPVHYVAVNSSTPSAPYTSWATAARNIQDAVDAATVPGALVLVTNGIYSAGERASSFTTSRVTVDKPVVVRSVNGPYLTEIWGGTNWLSQRLRCVYLADRAVLDGFSLTQGTRSDDGGGVWCESVNAVVTNCLLWGNSADQAGGGAYYGTLNNCLIWNNSVPAFGSGGGSHSSTLNNCTLSDNSAGLEGGGAYFGTLNNCTLTRNTANGGDRGWGGGASRSTLNNCTLSYNSCYFFGGGAEICTLNNCTLTGNSAGSRGGGAEFSTLSNCILTGNSASEGSGVFACGLIGCTLTNNLGVGAEGFYYALYPLNNCVLAGNSGGGALYCSLTNCTVAGNSGVGASYSTLENCIVYYNTAGNYDHSTNDYCCTTPLPTGTGNITNAPLFVDSSGWSNLRLQANSPCINSGNNAYAPGSTDLEGNPRIFAGVVDMGAYESQVAIIITSQPANQTLLPSQTANFSVSARTTAPLSYFWQRNGVFIPGASTASYSATNVQLSDSGSHFSCLVSNIYGTALSSNATLTVIPPVYYVSLTSTNPQLPYTSWATAAINIQDALGAATVPGSLVLVNDGVYQAGATAVYGMSNRVAVTRAVTVQSVNGPSVTAIVGYQVPGVTNGPAAIRCVYLTNGAVMSGFTLTNGATQTSGDLVKNESGGGVWCASVAAVLTNCVLVGNSAGYYGGGACYGNLNNCTLTSNSVPGSCCGGGGGVYNGTLNNCTLTGNWVRWEGGGAYNATLNNCTLTGNSAYDGGGAYYGTLDNCTLAGNSATYGGGAYYGTLTNSIAYYNAASSSGSDYYSSTLDHCCTTPSATGTGNLTNAPLFVDTNGWSALQLQASSPCINAGNNAYAPGSTDLGGNPRIVSGTVDIGAYEFQNAPWIARQPANQTVVVSGTSKFSVGVSGAEPLAYFWQRNGAFIPGATSAVYVTIGVQLSDSGSQFSCLVSNAYGTRLSSSAVLTVVAQPVHYVSVVSTNPVPPYTNWATAATNIQDALGAAVLPGSLVLVSNGVYQARATAVYGMSNRVAVTGAVTVRSVNGSGVTTISGSGPNGPSAVRCAYLTNGAVLSGFTLANGATQTSTYSDRTDSGGGVWCESASAVVSNCVLSGNSAYHYGGGTYYGTLNNCTLTGNSATGTGGSGGGAYSATLNNCTLTSNSASLDGGGTHSGSLNNCTVTGNSAYYGGGAYRSTLNNCMVTGNSASDSGGGASYSSLNNCTLTGNSATGQYAYGGGVYSSTLKNCVIYYNNAAYLGANYAYSTIDYCCTMPLPAGANNLTNEPRFLNTNGWANLRLQSNSPCINAGKNGYALGPTDLDGNPRIQGRTVDIGAYEFQSPASIISHVWLQQYGLPTDGSADFADTDRDGMNNWQEWVAGTDPTNPVSVLRLLTPVLTPRSVRLRWNSDTNHAYFVQRAATLAKPLAFSTLLANIPGLPGATTYTDTTVALSKGAAFYRVGTGSSNGPVSLRLQPPVFIPGGMTLTWLSVTNRTYFLERATNLAVPPVFLLLQTNIAGLPGTTSFTDTNPPPSGKAYYRVGVQP